MARSLTHGIIFGVIALFLFTRGANWAFLFLIIATFKLTEWIIDPVRKIDLRISSDASMFGYAVPSEFQTRDLLRKLYRKYLRMIGRYPMLKEEYQEIIKSAWVELAGSSPAGQRELIKSVIKNWPEPGSKGGENLSGSMKKARKAADHWRDARCEAGLG